MERVGADSGDVKRNGPERAVTGRGVEKSCAKTTERSHQPAGRKTIFKARTICAEECLPVVSSLAPHADRASCTTHAKHFLWTRC